MYTEEINKIALSSNDDKRTQTFDKVTTCPYGINVFMLCKNEMLLSALMNRSKNLKSNIDIYNDKLKSINSKLSMVTHTSNFI